MDRLKSYKLLNDIMRRFTPALAVQMVSDLRRLYDPENKGYIAREQLIRYLAVSGRGCSHTAVNSYIDILKTFDLLKRADHTSGVLMFSNRE
jgi:hypothetical protein